MPRREIRPYYLVVAALLASIPILLIIFFMVILNWPAKRVMPIAWVVALGLAAFYWKVPFNWLAGASVSGALNALNILIIVFASQFFGPLEPTLAAMYIFPFFGLILPLRIYSQRRQAKM